MRTKKKKHKTINIPLKIISVDKGIVGVVEWLNKFYEVCTLYSCEGGNGALLPYVAFFCRSQDSLERVGNIVKVASPKDVWLEHDSLGLNFKNQKITCPDFCIYFRNKRVLKDFKQLIGV
jgi:hypothetical protein